VIDQSLDEGGFSEMIKAYSGHRKAVAALVAGHCTIHSSLSLSPSFTE